MANINIKSYNEILGDMIRKIIADTPVNDISNGSVMLTLLEAIAANDYENNTAVLNVLELLNIDSIRNNDLDAYASNLGLSRNTAIKASGNIIISDTSITKRSTTLYPIRPAPIAGTSVLYVNDASDWSFTGGELYIGRGTPNFEGPLSYSSITDNGSFYTINLNSALENDHLISEQVIDKQGTDDRRISAGTFVKIPANNISPEIEYTILRDTIVPAGEDTSDSIPVAAVKAGSASNAGINTITLFANVPFVGASVTNVNAFINGRDTETDNNFRDRIKAYSSTLARGTKQSILSAIDGVSEEIEGKQVSSAVITEPASVSDPSIVYVDDGQGFQPSFDGQSVDLLVASASGNEEFLQLANYPLPRPQVVNNAEAPFIFANGMELKVLVDGIEESVVFSDLDFRSISSATISEVVVAINDRAETFKCRLTENSTRLLIYPTKFNAETIQVVSDSSLLDANVQLKFPADEFSYISLYKNSELLKEIEKAASVTTAPFSTWDIVGTGNLIVSVDGTPDQDASFDTSDFGGINFNALNLQDYVNAFNNKYAGITAEATTTGRMIITSNREGSSSSIEIVGGSYIEKMFGGEETSSVGQDSDFSLNRQNGNLQIKVDIQEGDVITAGSSDTKGNVISSSASNGTFNVSIDSNNRPSEIVIVVDADRVVYRPMNLAVGSTITISDEGSNTMRILSSSSSSFKNVHAGDFIYITNRGDNDGTGAGSWLDIGSCGLYKIHSKGEHINDGVDTYVEVKNANMVTGGPYSVEDAVDIQCFFSDKYPQIWRGSFASIPAAASINNVVDSINENINGVVASIFRTNFIKISSASEQDGSIATPVSVGNLSQIFTTGVQLQEGTQSHLANKIQEIDGFTNFRRSSSNNTNVWLGRYTYSDIKGSLTSDEEPSVDGSGPYSEELEDTTNSQFETNLSYNDSLNIVSGQNKRQTRDIRTIVSQDVIGTRHNVPRTLMDYITGDEYQVVNNLQFSSEDNLVAIIDNDSTAKTVDISFSRTGQVNSGSQSIVFNPTNIAFSANDSDNEPGIDFGSLEVWGKLPTQTNTNFNDYAIWFRARNWYASNGSNMIIRAKDYGPNGDNIRFRVNYPVIPDTSGLFFHENNPQYTQATYTFGSGPIIDMGLVAGEDFTVTDLGGYNFRLNFPASATTNNLAVGDIVNINQSCGFSAANSGLFRINAKNDTNKTIDIYNPEGSATIVGNPAVHTVQCVADVADSLDGTYFVLNAPNGDTVKFWFDNNDSGTIEPDIGITDRSYEINITTGDSAIVVASAVAAAILNDAVFDTATNGGGTLDTVTVTNLDNGPAAEGSDGVPATSFVFNLVTPGVSDTFETLNIPNLFTAYSISDNDLSDIVDKINESNVMTAAVVTGGTLIRSTKEETTPVNQLSYGHDSDPLNQVNEYVSLYDSVSWVLDFSNLNPNFQLKSPLTLNGVSASYVMDTVPNEDGSIGEYFKLVPVTLTNTLHHLTHKALSQLDIISNVDITNDGKKIQIKSDLLGSSGAIEVVGGRANSASFKIIGDSESVSVNGNEYLQLKIPASPNTLSVGQQVVLENESGVERLRRYTSNDTIDVVKINDETYEYRFNNKATNLNQFVEVSIVDANSVDPVSYPTPGLVWRWTHNDAGSAAEITDLIAGVVANQPAKYDASGVLGGATNTSIEIVDPGSVSSKLYFRVYMSGQPAQGDYITFENSTGNTWAAWFDIDGNGTAPTGASFLAASNQVEIDILSSDSPNEIASKLISILLIGGISADFETTVTNGASLSDVQAGNVVNALGTFTGWDSTNKAFEYGDNKVAGFTIVNVDADNSYFDVVNPYGKAMAATPIGLSSELIISTTNAIEWRLSHSSKIKIESVVISSGTALATTSGPHKLNVGDTFDAIDMPSSILPDTPGAGVGTVASVVGVNQFTYTTAEPDASISPAGFLLKTGDSITSYKIESLGFNNLFRLSRVSGDSPNFVSCGVAVDDVMVIGGSTFKSINTGEFRVLALDEDSIIYENQNGLEQLDNVFDFNNFDIEVNWTANSNQITGIAGAFANLSVGDWIRKSTDDDTFLVQVSGFNDTPELATSMTLGGNYNGITATTSGVALDQNSGIGQGLEIRDTRDLIFLEGDSVRIGDSLFISENSLSNWFSSTNSGTFEIDSYGTDITDGKNFIRVKNLAGSVQSDVNLGLPNTKLSISESSSNKLKTIKQVAHVAIDEFNQERRVVYLDPGDRSYKWSQSNVSSVSSLGRLKYNTDITTGVDGYLYYTGLLRKVQRIIDGFEPDELNFPGRKAVGSLIEVLPPLPRRVNVAIDVTTQDGINLSEISDEITSTIINYVSNLGVGEDVILSDVVVRVKGVDGVSAVTFITPEPSQERIPISSDEKAFIEADDISIA